MNAKKIKKQRENLPKSNIIKESPTDLRNVPKGKGIFFRAWSTKQTKYTDKKICIFFILLVIYVSLVYL